jgi:hypothetical protein
MTNRTMYDSVNLYGIPRPLPASDLVAYYLDGPYAVASVAQVEALFPGHRLVPIDVNGARADYARALDVETGDVQPSDCAQWLTEFKATNPGYAGGARGLIYSDVSDLEAIRVGTGPYILGRDYTLWVATGDGLVVTPAYLRAKYPGYAWPDGCVAACQNVWSRTYDSSVVLDAEFLPS